jgi:hypothetical protein
MAGPADNTLRDYSLNTSSPSIGATPVAAYVVVPFDATLETTRVTPTGVITTADSTITVAILPQGVAASAITVGGTVVVPVAGAAAGTSHMVRHSTNRRVSKGDVIRLTPAGASGANIGAQFTLRLRR